MPKKGVKGRLAPYVPVTTFRTFLERIRWVTTPKKVDKKLLDDYGIPPKNQSALLSALKFLGLIDDNGTPTSDFRRLQSSGTEFRNGLEEIVRKSYANLLVRFDALRGDRERVSNYFATNYSPATAKKATILFFELCREIGILAEGRKEDFADADAGAIKGVKASTAASLPEPTKPLSLRDLYAQKLIESDLNVNIGPGMDAEALREARQILRDRHEFIKEIIGESER